MSINLENNKLLLSSVAALGILAFSGLSIAQNQSANNMRNVVIGGYKTNNVQDCANQCAGNASCASFVFYTNSPNAGVCQFTSSQTPMNVAGAISGVPFRGNGQNPAVNQNTQAQNIRAQNYSPAPQQFQQQPQIQQEYAAQAASYDNGNYISRVNPYQGNYAIKPLPNYSAPSHPVNVAPPVQQQNTPQSGAIQFNRPNAPQQMPAPQPMPAPNQMQAPQVQQYQGQQYQANPQYVPANQSQQPMPRPALQQQYQLQPQAQNYSENVSQNLVAPALQQPSNAAPQVNQQFAYNANPRTKIDAPIEYSSSKEQMQQNHYTVSHTPAAITKPEVQEVAQQATQQSVPQDVSQESAHQAPQQVASQGPLRPQAKPVVDYEKYRGKDGMVDAAAMRRAMVENGTGPRYSVESEWAGIAKTSNENQDAKIYENSTPIPLPAEINEEDVMKTDSDRITEAKPKKNGLWSKIFKRELNDYAEVSNEDVEMTNSQMASDGPLRKN